MSQTKHQIEALLAEAGSQPRHRFGQNFMIDQNLVRLVADAGMLTRDDLVIEVGPGTGTLTEELIERAGAVLAVEIDRDLAVVLRNRFAGREHFSLIEGDALAGKHALNPAILEVLAKRRVHPPTPFPVTPVLRYREAPDGAREESGSSEYIRTGVTEEGKSDDFRSLGDAKLVANLPYNIASPLVIELLIAGVDLLAFTVQKEVALRLRAVAGSDEYGPLSVMAQMLASVEVLRTLPPQAFWPAPSIESALVRMVRQDRLGKSVNDFGRFVHAIFSFRRKMLRKSLQNAGYDAETLLASSGLDGSRRPEEFTPEELLTLFQKSD